MNFGRSMKKVLLDDEVGDRIAHEILLAPSHGR